MNFGEAIEALRGRTKFAVAASWVVLALGLASVLGQLLEAAGLADSVNSDGALSLLVGLVYVLYLVSFIASIVLVSMWIHRAHANLRTAGVAGLKFTPGWAIGWFFVPLLNLFKPFEAMHELWQVSHGSLPGGDATAPALVRVWWASWIIGNITNSLSTRLDSFAASAAPGWASLLGAASSVALALSAYCLIRIMQSVEQAQRSGMTASSVFD